MCVGLEVLADNGISIMQDLIGPDDAKEAKKVAPQTIRAIFGKDFVANAICASLSPQNAQFECDYFFN